MKQTAILDFKWNRTCDMAIEFDLITKQKVNVEDIPEDITWDERNGILIFHIHMDYFDAKFFLEACLTNEFVSNILAGPYIQLLDLIDSLDLKDYLINYSNDFADMPDGDEYSIPVINGKIQRKYIFSNNEECSCTYDSVYHLLGIRPFDLYSDY